MKIIIIIRTNTAKKQKMIYNQNLKSKFRNRF